MKVTIIEEKANAQQLVCSPMVGKAMLRIEEGAIVEAGAYLGEIESIYHRYPLHLPMTLQGYFQVKGVKKTPYLLQYKSEIITLIPAFLGADAQSGLLNQIGEKQSGLATLDEYAKYECAMDGTFYRRATPDAPAFIEEGQIIQPKQVIALIEVMKFFYQLQFEGKAAIRIEKIYAKDGASVLGGDVLFSYSTL